MHYLLICPWTISSEDISYTLKFTEFLKLLRPRFCFFANIYPRDKIKLGAVIGSVTSFHAIENHDGQIPREMSFSSRRDNSYGHEKEIRARNNLGAISDQFEYRRSLIFSDMTIFFFPLEVTWSFWVMLINFCISLDED